MAGHVVIRIAERLGGGEPLRTAYAVAEPNQHRAIALFKLRPDHTVDEQVEAVVELTQPALVVYCQQMLTAPRPLRMHVHSPEVFIKIGPEAASHIESLWQ